MASYNRKLNFTILTVYLFIVIKCINGVKIELTNRGFVAGAKIEAEQYSAAYSSFKEYEDCADPNTTYLGLLGTTTVLRYDNVDFGSGVKSVTVRAASMYAGEDAYDPLYVTVQLGSLTNPKLVTIAVQNTGKDRCAFRTVGTWLNPILRGMDTVFLTFPSSQTNQLHLDWFSFDLPQAQLVATDIIQAENFTGGQAIFIYHDCNNGSVSYVGVGPTSYIKYQEVDFGESGVDEVTLRLTNGLNFTIYVLFHVDSVSSAPFLTVPVPPNGDDGCNFTTVKASFDSNLVGVLDFFFTFSTDTPQPTSYWVNFDWFTFGQTTSNAK